MSTLLSNEDQTKDSTHPLTCFKIEVYQNNTEIPVSCQFY